MATLTTKSLTYHELHNQFWDAGLGLINMSLSQKGLEKVVIRTENGDHELCAIHREGAVLIFDLGQPIREGETAL